MNEVLGNIQRPSIGAYREVATFVRDMLEFRKKTEPQFAIYRATKSLRRVSPALVSQVVSGGRKLSLDRVDEFAKLLALEPSEKNYLRAWVTDQERGPERSLSFSLPNLNFKKNVSLHILKDWIHIYVKDLFQMRGFQKNPDRVKSELKGLASAARIDRALEFLLREGYLRRTAEGEIVLDTPLAVADQNISSSKVRGFHKAALRIALQALDLYSPKERLANTMTLALDEKSFAELTTILKETAERLQNFAVEHKGSGDRLYQVILNLSPVGVGEK